MPDVTSGSDVGCGQPNVAGEAAVWLPEFAELVDFSSPARGLDIASSAKTGKLCAATGGVVKAYVYGTKRDLPEGFGDFLEASRSAIISIDMHQGHLADTPDCPCPAPRARDIVAPIDRFHAEARAIGVPVIHVKSVLRKDRVDDVAGIPSAWW